MSWTESFVESRPEVHLQSACQLMITGKRIVLVSGQCDSLVLVGWRWWQSQVGPSAADQQTLRVMSKHMYSYCTGIQHVVNRCAACVKCRHADGQQMGTACMRGSVLLVVCERHACSNDGLQHVVSPVQARFPIQACFHRTLRTLPRQPGPLVHAGPPLSSGDLVDAQDRVRVVLWYGCE